MSGGQQSHVISAGEHQLALRLIADPGAHKLTEVEVRACRAVVAHWAQASNINHDELDIAKTLFSKILARNNARAS